jgi:hypothetical protein
MGWRNNGFCGNAANSSDAAKAPPKQPTGKTDENTAETGNQIGM